VIHRVTVGDIERQNERTSAAFLNVTPRALEPVTPASDEPEVRAALGECSHRGAPDAGRCSSNDYYFACQVTLHDVSS
jgi:hypothetical protein